MRDYLVGILLGVGMLAVFLAFLWWVLSGEEEAQECRSTTNATCIVVVR